MSNPEYIKTTEAALILTVRRHRDGATGTLTLEWNGRLTRFRTPAREGIEF